MFVEKWMTGFPVTLTPEMTISSAALKMSRYKFRHIPVVKTDSTGHTLVGMISKYDLARAFPKNLNPFSIEVSAESVPTPVSAIMTREVVTVTPDCAIEKAAWLLRERRINALPVLRHERLVGIIRTRQARVSRPDDVVMSTTDGRPPTAVTQSLSRAPRS